MIVAESSLNLPMTELTGEVGFFLGWGRDSAKWSTDKTKDVKECVSSALRRFYYNPMVDVRDSIHNWTFLKPVATIHLIANSSTAPLPEDFGGFEGLATVSQDGLSGAYWPLKQVSEEQIRVRYAAFPAVTGRPVVYAEKQIRGTNATRSNRSEFYVYPLPDVNYVVQMPYYFLPEYLTVNNPYPYGGAAHAETMKAGCRAAAELFLDGEKGPEDANYLQCLAASIQYDRRHQPKTLGLNMDRSDWLAHRSPRWPDGLWHPLGIGFLGEASYT